MRPPRGRSTPARLARSRAQACPPSTAPSRAPAPTARGAARGRGDRSRSRRTPTLARPPSTVTHYSRHVVRVRFAPSPTGSLHLGNALSAVANRRFADEHGGTFLLRIDDTDVARNVDGGAREIAEDLEWLGVRWDEGPVHQSARF